MSGFTPARSCMPPRATRHPVMTSSKIDTAPCFVHSATSASRNPGSGGTTPMLPTTGSTMTAAISPPRSAKSARSAATSLYGSVIVDFAIGAGHARRVGDAERQRARPGLHEQEVGVAVVAALELQDRRAPGEAARHADRRHRRLGAARHRAHHLDRRIERDERLGERTSSSVGAP